MEKQQLWLFFTVKCSFADPNLLPLFGQKPSANSCNVSTQRSCSGWQFELAHSRLCVLTACQANNPSCPPTQYTVAPRTAPTIVARAPSSAASVVLLKWTGGGRARQHFHSRSQREQNGHSGVNGHNDGDAEEEGNCRDCCGDGAGHYGNAFMVDSLQSAPPFLTIMLWWKQYSLTWSAANRPSDVLP